MFKTFKLIICITCFIIVILSLVFFISRILYVFETEVEWYEKASLVILLIAETFIIVHSVGYLIEVLRVFFKASFTDDQNKKLIVSKLESPPFVAILIPAYHEPLNIIKNTLICSKVLSYQNKHLYLLDDTRYDLPESKTEEMYKYKQDLENLCKKYEVNIFRHTWRGAKAGILNDFIDFIKKREKKESCCIYNQKQTAIDPKYLAVLDVDQNPFIDFLEPIISKLEEDSKIAFIQSPQYYTNYQKSSVASAANIQQAIFYEYICEGKGVLGAVLCCGTNIIYRTTALDSIGGFDETSVTEDVSTSFEFHIRKWKSFYSNKVSVFGMGPDNLFSYFTQQYRWAFGTLSVLKKLIVTFFKNPKALKWFLWWEYLLSSSFYLIGIVFIVISIFPATYLLFGFPNYVASVSFTSIIFIPYLAITLTAFMLSITRRGYALKNVIKGQWLLLATFPIYIKATINIILNRKEKFKITSKKGSFTIPLWKLWPQLFFITLFFFGTIWGLCRIYFVRQPITTLCFNTFWCFYNFIIIFSIIFFNYIPEKNGK
ncbi:MAG: Cellulose synthase catalytic subunit [UDP-forming] [Candidatus Anoxychlamydiales bacterium]|nr:Cellulose synthase catalytic subunit [UDP-forming] [Candidatus Anoxychlamydiales bacterium]